MQASNLKHLANVADLARLDFATTRVTLYTEPDALSAYYSGAYSAGERTIDRPLDVPDIDVQIDAVRFKQIAALFDDAEDVALSVEPGALRLKSKAHNLTARTFPAEEHIPAPEAELPVLITSSVGELLPEIEIASAFVANNIARPIFTGLHLIAAKGQLGIQASNGASTIYTTCMPAITPMAERVSITIPGQDALLGLRLLGSKSVDICSGKGGNTVVFRGDSAWFRCATIAGEWPHKSIAAIIAPRERARIKLNADTLAAVTSSVKIFEASADVQIVATDMGLLIRTAESEAGQYVADIEGEFLGDLWYDVNDIAPAAKLGTDIIMELPDALGVPARVSCGHRTVYITAKVHA